MSIGEFWNRDVVIVHKAENAVEAAKLMRQYHVGDVVVVMSDHLITISESDELLDTIEQMRSKGVRRAPVVSKEGELVGILTLDDLLDVLAEAFNDLVLLTGREQRRERETRGQSEKNRT